MARLAACGRPRARGRLLAIWPLLISIAAKGAMGLIKRHYGRAIRSAALVADASNDAMDALSAGTALFAIGLALWNPARLAAADDFGGCAVGMIVLVLGIRVMRDTVFSSWTPCPTSA